MTSDFIQHKEAGQKSRLSLLPKALRAENSLVHKGGLELTQHENFVNGAHDIFDLLEKYATEKESWKRSMGNAMSVLNNARNTIDTAEKTINAQNGRIQTLADLSTKDELTGLSNRKGFFEAFVRELNRTDRGHNDGGVLILIDIDNLKAINHLYGEEAGDACLQIMAQTLACEIRAMDVGARLNDDEFVLLLSHVEKKDALDRTQKLALRLNNLSFIWHGAEICISASLGIESYRAGDKAENIFKLADKRLAAEKKIKNGAIEMKP